MNKYLVPAAIQSRKALRQVMSFGITSEGVVSEVDQAISLCDKAISAEKESRDSLRFLFEREYSEFMGTPESVLLNLRCGDKYAETEGERLNMAWEFYLRGSIK